MELEICYVQEHYHGTLPRPPRSKQKGVCFLYSIACWKAEAVGGNFEGFGHFSEKAAHTTDVQSRLHK